MSTNKLKEIAHALNDRITEAVFANAQKLKERGVLKTKEDELIYAEAITELISQVVQHQTVYFIEIQKMFDTSTVN